jgi:hypothetical protein
MRKSQRELLSYKFKCVGEPGYDELCKVYEEEFDEKTDAVKAAEQLLTESNATIEQMKKDIAALKSAPRIPSSVVPSSVPPRNAVSSNAASSLSGTDEDSPTTATTVIAARVETGPTLHDQQRNVTVDQQYEEEFLVQHINKTDE